MFFKVHQVSSPMVNCNDIRQFLLFTLYWGNKYYCAIIIDSEQRVERVQRLIVGIASLVLLYQYIIISVSALGPSGATDETSEQLTCSGERFESLVGH